MAEKRVYLEKFLDDLELLKFEVRLSVDLHLLTIKQQAHVAELMDRIGKQITGWRKSSS